MTSVIAALTFGGNWQINDKDSINTSFPSFLKKTEVFRGKNKVKIKIYLEFFSISMLIIT